MNSGAVYELGLSGQGTREHFYFSDQDEAAKAYESIIKAFEEKLLSRDPQFLERDKIMGLSVMKTHLGKVQPGTMSSLSSQAWFEDEVYDAVYEMSQKLHSDSQRSTVI